MAQRKGRTPVAATIYGLNPRASARTDGAGDGAVFIDLAHAPDFALDGLEVRPAKLEVVATGGRRQVLEPRIMQVLVALARQQGEVVSRDDLIRACWGGRIVGEDAINRCISRLRRLARDFGGFELQTLARVGYRLTVTAADAKPSAGPWASLLRRLATPWAAGALAAGVLLLALAGYFVWRSAHQLLIEPAPSLAIVSFRVIGPDPAAREVAERLPDDIRGVLAETVAGATVEDPASGTHADMTLGGTVTRDGDMLRARATLTNRDGAILWSRDYARPAAEQGQLRDLVTVGAMESLFAAVEALRQPVKLDAETLALYIRRSELATTGDPQRPGEAERALDQLLARAPTLGMARGVKALHLLHTISDAPPAERRRAANRVHQEIDRAIRDSPHAGTAYDALYWLTRNYDAPGDLVAAEDVLLKGLANAPDTPFIQMRECRFLGEVGRVQAAVPYCARALALRPMGAPLGQPYATALFMAGSYAEADQAIERFARFHPEHEFTRSARFYQPLSEGDFVRARRLLASTETRPQSINDEAAQALELLMQARSSGTPEAADRAIAALRAAVKKDGLGAGILIASATQLGRLDDAFAAMDPTSDSFFLDMPVVYGAAMAPLRKDPRFWVAAARAGYVRYWRTRKIWPDFCNPPKAEMDCPAAAARAGV